jgi:hypothetical protein
LEVMGECENIWKQDLSKIHFKKGEWTASWNRFRVNLKNKEELRSKEMMCVETEWGMIWGMIPRLKEKDKGYIRY